MKSSAEPAARRGARATVAARAIVAALATLAFVRRGERPGELLRHEPTVVVGVAPAARASVVRAAPSAVRPAVPGAPATPAAELPRLAALGASRTAGRTTLRPKLMRSLAERARDGERVLVNVTAYCLKGTTRRGNGVRAGIIAADPRVFPLARHVDLFIGRRYFGRFLVDDTGRDIKGNRLDLWTESCGDARHFGRRFGTATLVLRGEAPPREPDVGPTLR